MENILTQMHYHVVNKKTSLCLIHIVNKYPHRANWPFGTKIRSRLFGISDHYLCLL